MKMRSIVGGIAMIAVGSLFLTVLIYLTRSEVPRGAKSRIRVGTSRSEVPELCGPPTSTDLTESSFVYNDPHITGWCVVEFDENGLVKSIDDESL